MLGLVLCNFIVPIPAIFMSRKVPTQIGNITGKRWIVYSISRASATTPPGVSISIVGGSQVRLLTARGLRLFS